MQSMEIKSERKDGRCGGLVILRLISCNSWDVQAVVEANGRRAQSPLPNCAEKSWPEDLSDFQNVH